MIEKVESYNHWIITLGSRDDNLGYFEMFVDKFAVGIFFLIGGFYSRSSIASTLIGAVGGYFICKGVKYHKDAINLGKALLGQGIKGLWNSFVGNKK